MVKSLDGVLTKKANTRETFTEEQIPYLHACADPNNGYQYFCQKFFIWLDQVAIPKLPENYKEEDWDWIN